MEIKGMREENVWDYENGFYWFSDPTRINKLLYHFELYKMIKNTPGDVFEFGVFKGASFIRFCQFRDTLENNYTRQIVGFDFFGRFPNDKIEEKSDLRFIEEFENSAGNGITKKELEDILNNKGFKNYNLIEGNVFDTLDEYILKKPELKLSLLHLDLDVLEPTKYVLNTLYEKIVSGGLIVIDDYNDVYGATKVVDDFAQKNNLTIKTLSFYKKPVYIIKP
jgi:hypothetical protein